MQKKPTHKKPIAAIYVAGKMHETDWRLDLFDEWYTPYDETDSHGTQLGMNPITRERDSPWAKYSHATICGLQYTGPFFVDNLGGHGYHCFEDNEHGMKVTDHDRVHGAALEDQRQKVQSWCFDAISRADLVFAWIDCLDCCGTIAEIGYAKALGKRIWIAGPERYNDLWFVYHMADELAFADDFEHSADTPAELFHTMFQEYRTLHPQLGSPIEEMFWREWVASGLHHSMPLLPQHRISYYQVDFAHIPTKTAIELDGFEYHSSTEDIARDRKRQRAIESLGWHVIRFGGKEVYTDAAACVKEVVDILNRRKRP